MALSVLHFRLSYFLLKCEDNANLRKHSAQGNKGRGGLERQNGEVLHSDLLYCGGIKIKEIMITHWHVARIGRGAYKKADT